MAKLLHVAIAGATGAVGAEFLRLLELRNYPVGKLTLLASKRSVGRTLRFRGEELPVEELTADAFRGVEHAFFSAGASQSKAFARAAVDESRKRVVAESADLLYHLLVVLKARGVKLSAVEAELGKRTAQSGHAEKASRPKRRTGK